MKVGENNIATGYVAIFWVDLESNKIFSVKSPLNQGERYGEFIVHKSCHYDSWSAIQKRNIKWQGKGLMYEDFSRGRAIYHIRRKCFYIYVCPLVRGNRKAQNNIIQDLHLSESKALFLYDDEHYILPTF